jgi:hypothetical protein
MYVLVIPAVMGYYFYYLSINERIPTFYVEPLRTVILDDNNVSRAPIKVTRTDGKEIKQDVISTTFYFFNQGKETIKQDNVYSPIEVTFLDSAIEILDFKVLKAERDVSKVSAKFDSTRNLVTITFNALEQYDGLVGQIIYDGQIHSPLIINGGIEGAKSFESRLSRNFLHPSIVLVGAILFLFGIYFYRKWILKVDEFSTFVFTTIILALLFLAFVIKFPHLMIDKRFPDTLDVGETEKRVYEFRPPGAL